jgi:hypothetical protein
VDFIYGKRVNVKKIVIFKSGSDFAAINFDVLKVISAVYFEEKKQWKNLASAILIW